MRLHGQEHIEALEKFVSMLDPARDDDRIRDMRQYIQLYKALQGRKIMVRNSPYGKMVIPLTPLISYASHMRTFGL